MLEPLPAFLTAPLACSPSNCNSPNTPLPPVPAGLSKSLSAYFASEMSYGLAKLATSGNFVSRSRLNSPGVVVAVTRHIGNATNLARLHQADPTDAVWVAFAVPIEMGIRRELADLSRLDPDPATANISFQFLSVCKEVVESLHRCAGRNRGSLCLHDIPSLVKDWPCDSEERISSHLERFVDGLDLQPLLDLVREDIATGLVRGDGWDDPAVWRAEVVETHRVLARHTCQSVVEILEEAVGTEQYRRLLECDDFVLRLLSWDFSRDATSSDRFVEVPLKFSKLLEFCCPKLSFTSALSPQPKPSTKPASSNNSDFDRFRPTPSTSAYFPLYPRYPPPRCCPPNRCSGNPPLDNYELVNRLLQTRWKTACSQALSDAYCAHSDVLRHELVRNLAAQITTLATTTSDDETTLALLETAIHSSSVWSPGSDNCRSLLAYARHDFRKSLFCVLDRIIPTCLCELTRVCDRLQQAGELSDDATGRIMDAKLRPITVPQDAAGERVIIDLLSKDIRSGKIEGEDWRNLSRSQLGKWYRSVEDQVNAAIINKHFPSRCDAYAELMELVGMPRLLEESLWKDASEVARVWGATEAEWYNLRRAVDPALKSAAANDVYWKLLADETTRSPSSDLRDAVAQYDYATIWNPLQVEARLNSSAVRLRLANDSDQVFQWSRAINDCTLAVYYGPPSLKAYYRRGFALAHLKMWDKAILDYQAALRIEPHNVLIKVLLKNARAKRPS